MDYEFILRFKLPENINNIDDVVERLGKHECTDALVSLGQIGYVSLEFIRSGSDASQAIHSAINDVIAALPRAILVETAPDYVGITDVAKILGMSRQNVRKLVLNNHQIFPAPVHSGNTSFWRLAQVLDFFKEKKYHISKGIVEVAQTTMQINITKEIQSLNKTPSSDLSLYYRNKS